MKAVVYYSYGSPDVLQYEEIEKPTVGDNEVLLKVRAASVNPYDWHFLRGMPYLLRLQAGLRQPKFTRLGVDVAGQVETVGRNVTSFQAGDTVFGICRGAFAEYVCADEAKLAMKPDNLTFEQAASVPIAGLTALQGLRRGGLGAKPAQTVLINGAGGGVGTFAVQIAKSFGAEVTAICSTRKVEMLRSIGANRVIDYTQENFTQGGIRYDLVLDCISNHSLTAFKRVLNSKGSYIMVGAADGGGRWMIGLFARLLRAFMLSRLTNRTLVMVGAQITKEDLLLLHELIKGGKVSPIIDRRYTLQDLPDAIRYLEQGHALGKVVITIP